MLASVPSLDLALWGTVTLLTVVVLRQTVTHGHHRTYPFFTFYLVVNLLQTVVGVALYQRYGFDSEISYRIAWTSQAVVVVARAVAAAEFCRRILGRYTGIWALARRILLSAGTAVLALAIYYGKDGFRLGVITLDIASEAFVVTFVLGTFLFASYYEVYIERIPRLVGVGLGIYSCFKILNDAVLGRYLERYTAVWNHAGTIAFLGILVIWMAALRKPTSEEVAEMKLKPAGLYGEFIPQVNRRLWELNEQLNQIWKLESSKL